MRPIILISVLCHFAFTPTLLSTEIPSVDELTAYTNRAELLQKIIHDKTLDALGSLDDKHPVCRSVHRILSNRPADLEAALFEVRSLAETIHIPSPAFPTQQSNLLAVTRQMLDEFDKMPTTNWPSKLKGPAYWKPIDGKTQGTPQLDAEALLVDQVGNARGISGVLDFIRVLRLMQEITAVPTAGRIGKVSARIDRVNQRWHQYNEYGRVLMPWELGLNRWVHGERFTDDDINPAPPYQIFFMHPSLGYEVDSLDQAEARGVFMVDVLGYQKLAAKNQHEQYIPLKWPWGVSGVVTYTGSEEDEAFGYGAMLQLKSFAFGAHVRDLDGEDDVRFLLSIDVGKLLFKTGDLLKSPIR